MNDKYRRKIGTIRPSHLMYTGGVGALVDLPSLSVVVRGLDEWDYRDMPGNPLISEDRLLAAVQRELGPHVTELRSAPWRDAEEDPAAADRVGVPVLVFPQWLRCTYCDELAPIDAHGTVWRFENDNPYRPDQAKFTHALCKKKGRKPLAVASRFVLACPRGHLDDFPYREFVHRGGACESGARMRMIDYGGSAGPNVTIKCLPCGAFRNMMEATAGAARRTGGSVLPVCRGRHPHLGTFDACGEATKLLIVGASNQWFPDSLSALAIPPAGASRLRAEVSRLWHILNDVTSRDGLVPMLKHVPDLLPLRGKDPDEVMAAIETHRKELETGETAGPADLLAPEWEVFTSADPPAPSGDFALNRPDVDPSLTPLFADVVQVERLREVKAFIGFTRIDAPDRAAEKTARAPLSRGKAEWVPASEVRGEGVFLRLPEPLVAHWEDRVLDSRAMEIHFQAYRQFRRNRRSGREGDFDPGKGWPGPRYMALHTLSHLLIRRIALECGYSSASIAERIYAGSEDDRRAGILLYTSAPDSEGTLGGLVALAEKDTLRRLVRSALEDARHCSSDPLCAERLPYPPHDFLYGAACHVCLFVSETTCERGNRFLDRRLLVDLGDPDLVLIPEGL